MVSPGPVKWLSQLVIVPKEKKPGEVRIPVDSREANKAILRTKFVTPTTGEIIYHLKGTTVFSELDFNKAFHQLETMRAKTLQRLKQNEVLYVLQYYTWVCTVLQKYLKMLFNKC